MTEDPRFFDWVAERVKENWPADVMELGDRRHIVGQIETTLLFEVEPQIHGIGHSVLTRTEFARNVPDTEGLHKTLLELNRSIATVTFGTKAEEQQPGCVAVRASSALLGESALNPTLINESIRSCLSAAFMLLERGFIDRLGGEVGRDVTLREMGIL